MLHKSGEQFRSLSFSPNGRRLAVGSASLNGFVWVYDLSDKKPKEFAVLRGARGAMDALAFSPDSKQIAGGGEDRTLRVWEPAPGSTGAPRTQLAGHAATVLAVAFAPDGHGLATASGDDTVKIWSLSRIRSTERASLTLIGEPLTLAFSPDGKTLATAGGDTVIRLWDMTAITPRLRAELDGHTGVVRALVVSPDGRTLVSAGEDRRVMNWDMLSGKWSQEWQLPDDVVGTAFALTLDGRYLAVGTADGSVQIYRVAEKR